MTWGGRQGRLQRDRRGDSGNVLCFECVWFHGITTIKTYHVVSFKWMPFIAYKLCLNKVDLKIPRERIEREDKRGESKVVKLLMYRPMEELRCEGWSVVPPARGTEIKVTYSHHIVPQSNSHGPESASQDGARIHELPSS